MFKKNLKKNINSNIKDYLDNIVERIPYFIFWKNTDSVYLGCNQKFANLVNKKSPQEVIGETDFTLGWGEGESELFRYGDLEVMNGNPKINEEEILIRSDGSRIIMLVNKLSMLDKQGSCIGVLCTSVDITERKILEENLRLSKEKAEVANQAKTEFLENMRHDIRTPLSGIAGCAQLIQMQANNPRKVAEYADDLVQSSDALLEFLNKILESIQVASGEIPFLKKRFDLYRVLEQVIQLNKPEAHIKHLKLQLNYDKTIPDYLLGDPVRVQRIILELVTNALKFTDKGEVKITARLEKNKTKTGQIIVSLRVSDTGMGIPLAQQNEVYTRFKRLTPSYQGIYPGTGLGLAVVKQFIDDLGGEIHLESKPKQGSTFTCLVPFQESLSEKNKGDVKVEKTSSTVLNNTHLLNKQVESVTTEQKAILKVGSRVLVIEDNPIAIKVAQGILSGLNCQVDFVANGKTAVTAIEKNQYDLILIDIGLPDGDGSEITRRIRLKWQGNPSTPIIGLTAHLTEEKKRLCLKNGMNAVYAKPLTTTKASEMLNIFLLHSYSSGFTEEIHELVSDNIEFLPILNKERALKLLSNEEVVYEIWTLLESELTKELADLRQYHQIKDWSAMHRLAHKWRGGASYCGAIRLEQACQRLEAVLQTEMLKEVERHYQTLLQITEATIKAIN